MLLLIHFAASQNITGPGWVIPCGNPGSYRSRSNDGVKCQPMKTLAVFDPAISFFDPALVRFAADLAWVEKRGVKVSRHNFGKEPQAFAANPAVAREMETGMDRLPVILVDGRIVSAGAYPSRQQLARKLGIAWLPEELSLDKSAGCCCKPWLS